MLLPQGRKPYLWDNRCPWGKVRTKAASVRKVTLPFNKMQFSKCRHERQVGTKSHFLNSFNPKRQCSLSEHQGQRPWKERTPEALPKALSPTLSHTQPCAPFSCRAKGCATQPAWRSLLSLLQVRLPTTCQSFPNLLWATNGWIHYFTEEEEKNSVPWPVFSKGWVFWIFAAVLREPKRLAVDKVDKGVRYRHLSCAHL